MNGAVTKRLTELVTTLRRDEKKLERYLRQAQAGIKFELPQLIALQQVAFRYTQQVELLTKLVDRATRYVQLMLARAGRTDHRYEDVVRRLFAVMDRTEPGESVVVRTYRSLLRAKREPLNRRRRPGSARRATSRRPIRPDLG